ncbi:hypothetical protein MOO44_00880 (plasmid) [Nicoliella spurrieriana]|uniref:Uncharacterized protein n=1 Tax=Nicoliella spurrieriana TaxID=2925830 RepID=A0A976RRD9_9LACO|nr:hypothetical protein [Nicoliella spurrieriana]UQS86226.1 hypothetical protein MOO44_00880 [Nicoliella spurrieriana]
MQKMFFNNYTFLYEDSLTYFLDERYQNILFVKKINNNHIKKNKINFYDGANIIIQKCDSYIKFHPLWNVCIEQVDDKTYKLSTDD